MRKSLGWSQKDLAEALGVHPQTYSKWERGVQRIEHPELLKMSIEYLIGREK